MQKSAFHKICPILPDVIGPILRKRVFGTNWFHLPTRDTWTWTNLAILLSV